MATRRSVCNLDGCSSRPNLERDVRRSIHRAATDQPRADGGRALGRVLPRRPGALGHRAAAAGDRAPWRARRRRARPGVRNGRERPARRGDRRARPGRRRGRDRGLDRPTEGRGARHRRRVRGGRRPAPGAVGPHLRDRPRLRAVSHLRRRRAARLQRESGIGDKRRRPPVRALLQRRRAREPRPTSGQRSSECGRRSTRSIGASTRSLRSGSRPGSPQRACRPGWSGSSGSRGRCSRAPRLARSARPGSRCRGPEA